jgi:hypothetical protein
VVVAAAEADQDQQEMVVLVALASLQFRTLLTTQRRLQLLALPKQKL